MNQGIAGRRRRRNKQKQFSAFVSPTGETAGQVKASPKALRGLWKGYLATLKEFVKNLQAGAIASDTPAPPVPDADPPPGKLRRRVQKWQGRVAVARQIAANLEAQSTADEAWRASITDGVVDPSAPPDPPQEVYDPPSEPAPAPPPGSPDNPYMYAQPYPSPVDRMLPAVPPPGVPQAPDDEDDEEPEGGVPIWAWVAGGAAVLTFGYFATRRRRGRR